MIPTSVILIVSGVACLGIFGFIAYTIRPRGENTTTFWTRTETRATASALGLLILFITGGSLVAKGIFA